MLNWSEFPAPSWSREATPELTATLKEDMGRHLGALKPSHGCSLGLRWSLVVISGVAVHRRAESSREALLSELLTGV